MSRLVEDWIDGYLRYHKRTESAKIFHKWAAISVIAAALRKKIYLSLGRIKIYPNLYIVFVGDPGVARKTQAINFARKFLQQIQDIRICADAVTPRALLEELQESQRVDILPDGRALEHCSLTVTSKEFEVMLGQKSENTLMIVRLTDLYDEEDSTWKYRTKHSGENVLPSCFLNILAATTPSSIANSLNVSAISGGLASRIMYIWADEKEAKITAPVETDEEKTLKEALIQDLYKISRMAGVYHFSTDAFKKWDEWYQAYDEKDPNRICKDPTFDAWYSRKPTTVLKVAMCCAAGQSSELTLRWRHIERALSIVEEAEVPMANVFRAVGRSAVTADVDKVMGLIKAHGWIQEKKLLSLVWRDIDAQKFDNVIQTLIKSGKVRRSYEGPRGERNEIWYYYTGV